MKTCDEFCIDACSVINLVRGEALEHVIEMLREPIVVVGSVLDEISDGLRQSVDQALEQGLCNPCSANISYEDVRYLVETRNIGAGEAHAILSCATNGACLICDDRRARIVASEILGEHRIIGSLGLLCALLARAIIDINHVTTVVGKMEAAGGFLPTLGDNYWKECEQGTSRVDDGC